ncbi:Major facilitator superfamily domain general substrate transporter [Penicillium cf. griseofulvum]|uniref:Autophagy-related protein n=1 Tax=Penicillium cf. griseofulvum TaxID=2972120 RepID=A0A9W9IUI8_9EURO|nr:Major facilitator superfamily domain general substrate transporter [Penicillium cf. griseofulvum]KAJ5429789.1 Major facilitator superfamily domain general substrate transporter [Penicillium cf. griseofulvum]KAJ5436441.1 Major facilitator superfamily domain general substrate transporter [Penicillium cf. griseofulvum]
MAETHENLAKDGATVAVNLNSQPHPTLEEYERLFGVDEDSYEQPTTTRKELWSYYLYYNGDNGVGPGSYSQALFQWALNGAGHQPGSNPPKACTDSSACVVPWAGGTRSVSSVVLIANGLCFTFMTVIFVWLGSAADYGTFGRWLLLALTVVCWALQYGMMSIQHPSQWPTAMGLYVVAYIAYGATLVFYAAVFPRLARYTPHVRKAREEDLTEGKIDQEEYDAIESLERNHISNISTAHSNIGYLLTLVLNLSVLLPLQNNSFSNNLALCLTNSYWVILGIWWFIFQQKRPGPKIPKGSSYATIGFKQIWLAIREIRSLPQTFLYFFAYFLLADGLNTTGTLVSIIQNDSVSFSFLQITYLGITQAACSITSTFGFWYIQRYFKFKTKTMFLFTNFFTVLIPFWGMLGLWTHRIGYHNRACSGSFTSTMSFSDFSRLHTMRQYAQTMISELMPRGYDNMFFALFGITNRASSIIGPNVIQAIINNTHNSWMGFPFLFAICAAAMITICFVDIKRGREDCRKFTEQRKIDRVVAESGLDPNDIANGKQPVRNKDFPEVQNEHMSTLLRG